MSIQVNVFDVDIKREMSVQGPVFLWNLFSKQTKAAAGDGYRPGRSSECDWRTNANACEPCRCNKRGGRPPPSPYNLRDRHVEKQRPVEDITDDEITQVRRVRCIFMYHTNQQT